jgi:hypothetical protein
MIQMNDPRLAEEVVESLDFEAVQQDVVRSQACDGDLPDPFEEVLGG